MINKINSVSSGAILNSEIIKENILCYQNWEDVRYFQILYWKSGSSILDSDSQAARYYTPHHVMTVLINDNMQ